MGMDVYAVSDATGKAEGTRFDPELYFRDCYNSFSLANWLAQNIDSAARGAFGLAIFTEPREPLNSSEWRQRLLHLASFWADAAQLLRGHETRVGYPGHSLETISVQDTEDFIQETEDLLRFAVEVHRRNLRVVVWA
jgi:hypothetical protein